MESRRESARRSKFKGNLQKSQMPQCGISSPNGVSPDQRSSTPSSELFNSTSTESQGTAQHPTARA